MTRVLTAILLLVAAEQVTGAETARTEAARLRFDVPKTWTRVPAAADAQAARYRLPAAPGDLAETEIVLLVAADGKSSTADMHLERWYGRFTQLDGRASKSAGAVTTRTVNDLRVTRLDLSGTYVGSAKGAIEAGVSGYRMLGAVVEGDGGPWVFEVLGPKATVGNARAEFDALLFSLELHR